MRQRRVRNREEILADCQNYIYRIGEPLPEGMPVCLEIGSGKGRFLTQKALRNPDIFYLACEGGLNINVRILQKAKELELQNLKVITEYITKPCECFSEGAIDTIYINFPDPWPKDRHEKRRLMHRELLAQYMIIARGGMLEFKTDNDELFEWSLSEIAACDLPVLEMTRDLYSSPYLENNIQTEYEEKFSSAGKTINYIKLAMI